MKLTPKQSAFIDEYTIDKNAAAAAVRAGYSQKTVAQLASRLLTNVNIQAEVNKRLAKLSDNAQITAEYVLNGFKSVAERCMADETFDQAGANKSLEMLGKYLRLFTDNVNVKMDAVIEHKQDLSKLSKDELEKAFEIARKISDEVPKQV